MMKRCLNFALVLVIVFSILSIYSEIASAGGADGNPGIIDFKTAGSTPSTGQDSALTENFKKRHVRAIEYALENDEYLEIIENLTLKLSLTVSGVPPKASDITLALKNQIDRINYAEINGLDFQFWHKAVAEILETLLVTMAPDGTGIAVTATKAATAFVTAYIYGFIFGK